jgi:hypothetical protein
MAKTTAQITLASPDIADNTISISNVAYLTKAGSAVGLDQTSGLRRRTFTSTSTVKLIDLDHYQDQTLTANKAAKVYIKNTGTSTAEHVKVGIQNAAGALEEIGWLYGGDWMFFPYSAAYTSAAHANNQDIDVTPSSTDSVTLEYIVFYE